jgi:serine/threonine-protein kinase
MREERVAATRSLVGQTVANAYRVVRMIGEGAMGAIYEARQLRLDKRVAIKVLARELAANGEALLRFHREAEITSTLGHPHIINVFDFGTTENGQPFLVMEYLEGEDLANLIHRKHAISLRAAVRITRQVASALAETHAKGVVHRDLKPANLFIMRVQGEDFTKVLDFGISKVRAASTALTNASTLMGTPMYMAPEQAKGDTELDHLTDQWALACISYEMLAGRPPFIGDDTAALLYQVVHEEPARLSNFVKDLPPEVERVVRRALAKEPSERFPNVTAFARAFEAAATGQPLPTETPGEASGRAPLVGLTPVETAATIASSAEAFAPPTRRTTKRTRRNAIWVGVAIAAAGGFMVWSQTSGTQPVVPPTTAAPPAAVGALPAAAPTPAAPAPDSDPENDEPAAPADDTESASPTVSNVEMDRTRKREGVRRHPIRRANSVKRAETPAPDTTPATNSPVRRKLINEL